MTDRYSGLMVTLERDVRADDAEALISAIRHLRGVADVTPQVVGMSDAVIALRTDHEWANDLLELIQRRRDMRMAPADRLFGHG